MSKKIRIISFTARGASLGKRLACAFFDMGYEALAFSGRSGSDGPDGLPFMKLADFARDNFRPDTVLIFIGAAGIAVRAIAPYVSDKKTDAAVIVIDEKGESCIPVLSGHIGEANLFAEMAAAVTGGRPVLTTATDVNGLFAVDVLANRNDLVISNMMKAKAFSAALLESRRAEIVIPDEYADMIRVSGDIPAEAMVVATLSKDAGQKETGAAELPAAIISPSRRDPDGPLQLIPRCLAVGIGCRRGKSFAELKPFFEETLSAAGLDPKAVFGLYSIDLKKEEEGIKALAAGLGIPFETFSAEKLQNVCGEFSPSAFVAEMTGVDNVCERAAMAAVEEAGGRLILKKTAQNGMTIAAAIRPVDVRF